MVLVHLHLVNRVAPRKADVDTEGYRLSGEVPTQVGDIESSGIAMQLESRPAHPLTAEELRKEPEVWKGGMSGSAPTGRQS